MRTKVDSPVASFTARIPENEKIALDALLEMQGGKSWLVNTALQHFLDVVEASPEIEAWCHRDVQRMLNEEETPSGLVDLIVRVPRDPYNRFNAVMGEWGATTWFFRRMVKQYLALSESWPHPEAQVAEAIHRMLSPDSEGKNEQ